MRLWWYFRVTSQGFWTARSDRKCYLPHNTPEKRPQTRHAECGHNLCKTPSEPDKTAILAGFRYERSDGITAKRSTIQNTVQSHRNPLSNDHIGRCTNMVFFLFGRTFGRTLGRTSQIVYKNRKVSFGRTFGRTFFVYYRIYSDSYHIISDVKLCEILFIKVGIIHILERYI